MRAGKQDRGRFSSKRKREAVLRLPGGEDPDLLSRVALREVERKRKRPTPVRRLARSEFSIRFGDRFRSDTG